ncbi:4044_t:CDS:2, partial [Funneliformis geosporum]
SFKTYGISNLLDNIGDSDKEIESDLGIINVSDDNLKDDEYYFSSE